MGFPATQHIAMERTGYRDGYLRLPRRYRGFVGGHWPKGTAVAAYMDGYLRGRNERRMA